jgi:hypothetical protein
MNEEKKLEFYTVDRAGTLDEGQLCSLVKHSDVEPPVLADHVKELFPDGVSTHGERYFLQNEAQAMVVSPILELLFEQVRRAAFADRPSRFQSMFAFKSLAEACSFLSQFGDGAIYKVNADVFFRGNMNLLNAGNSILTTSWFANQYWKGETGLQDDPCWEFLLKCPVKVGERVA